MNQKAIAKASEIINTKSGFIGDGMDGYVSLALIDEDGSPVITTISIARADGVKWLTFVPGSGRNSVKRASKCNRACVCLNSRSYHISLVGTIEVLTDAESKRDNWMEPLKAYWNIPEEADYCVLRFTTERYTIYLIDQDFEHGEIQVSGSL
jgi:general stress protein 26